jgi:hypothetical protein
MAGEGPPSTTFSAARCKVVDADLRRRGGRGTTLCQAFRRLVSLTNLGGNRLSDAEPQPSGQAVAAGRRLTGQNLGAEALRQITRRQVRFEIRRIERFAGRRA